MHSTAPVANQYLRFLHQMHRTTTMGRLVDLEPVCNRLLDEIAIEDHCSSPLTVTALMGLSHIASPATLHRKLDGLRDAGYVESFSLPNDKRTKYLKPCAKAMKHFSALSDLVAHSLQTAGR